MRFPHELVARHASAALLLIGVWACQSMQPVPVRFIPETNPPVVYLSDGNGVTQAIANPRLSGDTVLGTTVGANVDVAVPLHEVQRVATVRLNRGRTAMLVGGLVAAGGLMSYVLLNTDNGKSTFYCDWSEPKRDGVRCDFN
jgi:hypothetical protein